MSQHYKIEQLNKDITNLRAENVQFKEMLSGELEDLKVDLDFKVTK